MAETITLGKVSVSPKGAYSSTVSYTFLDAVSHNGGAFLCLQNSTGVEPGVSSGWQSYWMETSKGIKQISISSAQEGQATITVTLSDGTVSTVTFDTGVVVAQTGEGPPTTATVAAYIGQLYVDTTATENPAYICVGITTADNVTTYVWQPVGGEIEASDITDALGFNPGMVNPNLLDNWYFVGGGSQQGGGQFPINQRGQTSYSGVGYGIDRWTDLGANATIALQASGLEINANGQNFQYIAPSQMLNGAVYTVSSIVDGELYSHTFLYDNTEAPGTAHFVSCDQKANLVFYTNLFSSGNNAVGFNQVAQKFETIAIKLEISPRQTLAHQENGQWVLNEIPNFEELLARCQRYYQIRSTNDIVAADMRPLMRLSTPAITSVAGGYGYSADL